jgi:DNA-binding MarR family transcriptional regulator
VVDALASATRAMVGLATRSLAHVDVDVTVPQLRALAVLVSAGPQRIVDLAHELGVQPSTATRMCNRLVGRGLVSRGAHPADRRAAWVTLTPAGKDLVGQIMRHRQDEIARMVSVLHIEQPEAFAATLLRFVAAAGEVPDPEWWRRWQRTGQGSTPPARTSAVVSGRSVTA